MSAERVGFEGSHLAFAIDARGVLEVRLRREPANEIGVPMLRELEEVVRTIPSARALVIGSEVARGFCAGADLRELHRENAARKREGASIAARTAEVRAFLDRIHAVMDAICGAPITTVAAVHGVCFGGGFELALACDLIVADRTARFAFPELRLGLIPGFGGIPRLERDLPNGVVRDLLLTGRSLGAARAQQLGLVSQLVAPGEHLAVARRVAEQATRFDPRATAAAKRFAKPDLRARLAAEKDLFCELFASETVERALARFDADTGAMPYLPASHPASDR